MKLYLKHFRGIKPDKTLKAMILATQTAQQTFPKKKKRSKRLIIKAIKKLSIGFC